MIFHYSDENWQDCLAMLGFEEKENDILDEKGRAKWHYADDDEKVMLYAFFMGMICGRIRT